MPTYIENILLRVRFQRALALLLLLIPQSSWAGLFVGNPPSAVVPHTDLVVGADQVYGTRCDGGADELLAENVSSTGGPLGLGTADHCGYRLVGAWVEAAGFAPGGPGSFDVQLDTGEQMLPVPAPLNGAAVLWLVPQAGWHGALLEEMGSGHLIVLPGDPEHDALRGAWLSNTALMP